MITYIWLRYLDDLNARIRHLEQDVPLSNAVQHEISTGEEIQSVLIAATEEPQAGSADIVEHQSSGHNGPSIPSIYSVDVYAMPLC